MQFLYPNWLNVLWVLPVLFVFFVWLHFRRRRVLAQFGYWKSINKLSETHSETKVWIKQICLLAAIAFFAIATAQPQWGEQKKEIKRKGVEIIFLLDTSLSMLAEDIKPSRFEKAKLAMKSFVKALKGDRIGIVTFAGTGFIQSPLTLDYDAFFLFANSIQVGFIPDAGTSLSEAIQTTVKAFPEAKQKNHVAIVLSDGEHHEGDVSNAIKIAKSSNVRIYTIGLGTPEGVPIPLRSGEKGAITGYKKDRNGEVVITRLNEPILKQIAEETGGRYARLSPSEREIEWIYQDMQNIEKKEFKQKLIVEREDHFQIFIGFGLFFILLEMLIGETKSRTKVHV